MKNNRRSYDIRKAHIYRNIYRHPANPFYFIGNLLSVLLQGRARF
jgi:hypothetical protein